MLHFQHKICYECNWVAARLNFWLQPVNLLIPCAVPGDHQERYLRGKALHCEFVLWCGKGRLGVN